VEGLDIVLYWLGNALAILCVLLIVAGLFFGAATLDLMVCVGAMVLFWVAGYFVRYLFAGK
jgi:hypothetical protein